MSEKLPFEADVFYDAGPTGCGELIMNLHRTMKGMSPQEMIEVVSYDPGAREDIPAWCRLRGYTLVKQVDREKETHYFIRKEE